MSRRPSQSMSKGSACWAPDCPAGPQAAGSLTAACPTRPHDASCQCPSPCRQPSAVAASIAIALAKNGHNVPYAYNRKEAKDHGEGGVIVGAPLQGRVLIIDDVISAGTSVRESIDLIQQHGATACGVAIALDRQEKGLGELSAVQEVEITHHFPVCAIANLSDLLEFVANQQDMAQHLPKIQLYRQLYGIK